MTSKIKDIIYKISALLILVASAAFLLYPSIAPYIMAIGVVGYGSMVFTTPYPGKSLRGKRLHNMHIFSVLFMAVAAFLMFYNKGEWIIMVLSAAFLIGYSTIQQHKVYTDEQKQENNK